MTAALDSKNVLNYSEATGVHSAQWISLASVCSRTLKRLDHWARQPLGPSWFRRMDLQNLCVHFDKMWSKHHEHWANCLLDV